MDVKTAFLNGNISEDVYIYIRLEGVVLSSGVIC